MNKSFDRSALLYKIILQNSRITPDLFQLNHVNEHLHVMKINCIHGMHCPLQNGSGVKKFTKIFSGECQKILILEERLCYVGGRSIFPEVRQIIF